MVHKQSFAPRTITGKAKASHERPHPAIKEIRKILVAQAKKGKPMTYLHLISRIRSVNLIPNSRELRDWLISISMNEYAAGRPLLSAVVVRKHRPHEGIPGRGFFTKLPPMWSCKKTDWPKCWQREVEKVYRYWKRHGGGSR